MVTFVLQGGAWVPPGDQYGHGTIAGEGKEHEHAPDEKSGKVKRGVYDKSEQRAYGDQCAGYEEHETLHMPVGSI